VPSFDAGEAPRRSTSSLDDIVRTFATKAPRIFVAVLALLSVLPVATSAFVYGAFLVWTLRLQPLSVNMPSARMRNFAFLAGGEAILIAFILAIVGLSITAFRATRCNKSFWLGALTAFALMSAFGIWDYLHAAPKWSLIGPLSLPAFLVMLGLLWIARPTWRIETIDT
jgi:hypothetical protein